MERQLFRQRRGISINTSNASYLFILKYVNALDSEQKHLALAWHKITSITFSSRRFKRIAFCRAQSIDIHKNNVKRFIALTWHRLPSRIFRCCCCWIRHRQHYSVLVCGFIHCFFLSASSKRNVYNVFFSRKISATQKKSLISCQMSSFK